LVESILAEGAQRMARWEEKEKEKTASAAKEAENTEFTRITSEATSSTSITAEQEAAAEKLKETGNVHFKAGKYQLAIDAYTEALYLNKYNATYWSNRSACYLGLKEPTKALKDAEICRQLNPTWPRGCYRLASARLALGQYEDAAVAAFEGVKLDEHNQELKALLQKAVKLGQDEHKAKIAAGKS
jgi:tetratricopeptide (TPR) repeat protein